MQRAPSGSGTCVGGLAGGDRHAHAELGERQAGERHEQARREERQGCVHPRARCCGGNEHVDAGTDGHAEAVEHDVRQRERAAELGRRRHPTQAFSARAAVPRQGARLLDRHSSRARRLLIQAEHGRAHRTLIRISPRG